MLINGKEVDLNKPYGEADQTVETPVGEPTEAVVEKTETVIEPVEETKVPYSRFKNVNQARRDAEAEAERWREEAERLRSERTARATEAPTGEMPDWWKENYGDTDASKRAWQNQVQHEARLAERVRQEALQSIQQERQSESRRYQDNIKTIDANLEDLSDSLGKNLTDAEESALLDIVDEYTPKDENGDYIGATIPFEKAWKIYEMQQKATTTQKRDARNGVADLTAYRTQGEPSDSVKAEQDKNFIPGAWSAWRSQL